MAIKMYRMALDQIPNTGKEVRLKIMRNIGNSFVRLGQFQDAIQSYEAIMEGNPGIGHVWSVVSCGVQRCRGVWFVSALCCAVCVWGGGVNGRLPSRLQLGCVLLCSG